MDRILRSDEVHAVDGQRQQPYQNRQQTIPGQTLLFLGKDKQEDHQKDPAEQEEMQLPGSRSGHEPMVRPIKEPEEIHIGKADAFHDTGKAQGNAASGVVVKGDIFPLQNHLGSTIVNRQGDNEKGHIANAFFQNCHDIRPGKKIPDQQENQQACGDGNIGLVNAERSHLKAQCQQPTELLLPGQQPQCQNAQEEGKAVGAAGKHIAKQPNDRRKHDDATGQQHLQQFALYMKQPDDQADAQSEEHQRQDTVDPGHGIIGENAVQCPQTPAAGGDSGTLAKKLPNLIVVDKLVGEGEHVSKNTPDQTGQKGHPVGPKEGSQPVSQ